MLRKTVCDLYSNLVTRPTGVAVRKAIEASMAEGPSPRVTVIDFTQVNLLDFSCADEVVGKLLDAHRRNDGEPPTYFLIRGVHEGHLEAIESVLERYDLAVVVEDLDGRWQLVGSLDDMTRRAWQVVRARERVLPEDVAQEMGEPWGTASRVLEDLSARRLVMRRDDGFVTLPQAI